MRFLLSLVLVLAVTSIAAAEEDPVDSLRRVERERREEASAVSITTKVYYMGDLAGAYRGDAREVLAKILDAIKKNVPDFKDSESVTAFPTNMSLVASLSDEQHKKLAKYLDKLRKAKAVADEAGFEFIRER